MAWWSWVLIWLGLALLLIGMLAWFAWRLFGKLIAVGSALEALIERTSVLSGAANPEPPTIRTSALFMSRAELAGRRDAARDERAERIAARRQHRLSRGKLLTRADYREFLHLSKRT